MKLLMGSDKSGFPLKEELKAYLTEKGYEIEDLGTRDMDHPMPFFETAPIVARRISEDPAQKAILICGTGMGMSQVANMYKNVYAACCESLYAAKMSRAVNDSNILCLGGWIVAREMAIDMADAFLETEFTQGLEEWRKDFLKGAKQKVGALNGELRG